MSEEELVDAFTKGRISRRIFVRRLVESGRTMPEALAYADALEPEEGPAPAGRDAGVLRQPAPPLADKPVKEPEIDINFVGDGYIVYHPSHERVHSLNHTAALVLEFCTGENSQSQIADMLRTCFDLSEAPVEETQQCLTVLHEEGLIH